MSVAYTRQGINLLLLAIAQKGHFGSVQVTVFLLLFFFSVHLTITWAIAIVRFCSSFPYFIFPRAQLTPHVILFNKFFFLALTSMCIVCIFVAFFIALSTFLSVLCTRFLFLFLVCHSFVAFIHSSSKWSKKNIHTQLTLSILQRDTTNFQVFKIIIKKKNYIW